MNEQKQIELLRSLCDEYGLTMTYNINGHVQIKSCRLIVNYYPFSKDKTAYVAGTKKGITGCSNLQVIKMALTQPKIIDAKVKRANPNRYKREKMRLIKKNPNCHWCDILLTIETATIEHIIPLKRGGLDNANNITIACKTCNQSRGHDMPELKQGVFTK